MLGIQFRYYPKRQSLTSPLLTSVVCAVVVFTVAICTAGAWPNDARAQDVKPQEAETEQSKSKKWGQELVSGFGRSLNYAAKGTLAAIDSARSIPLQLTMKKPSFEHNVPDVESPDGFVIGFYATPLQSELGVQTLIDFKGVNDIRDDWAISDSDTVIDHPFEIGLSYGARISPNVSFILTPSYQFSLTPSDGTSVSSSGQQMGLSLGLFWESGVSLGLSGFAHNLTIKERASSRDYEGFATGLDVGIAF